MRNTRKNSLKDRWFVETVVKCVSWSLNISVSSFKFGPFNHDPNNGNRFESL